MFAEDCTRGVMTPCVRFQAIRIWAGTGSSRMTSLKSVLAVLCMPWLLACPALADLRPIGGQPIDPSFMKLPDSSGYTYAGPVRVRAGSVVGEYGPGDVFRTFRVDLAGVDAAAVYSLPGEVPARPGNVSGVSLSASSSETAWLYRQFLDGTLDDYVSSYSDSAAGNAALQQAIWYSEGKWLDAQGQPAPIRGTAMALWDAALAHASADDAIGIVAHVATAPMGLAMDPGPAHMFLLPVECSIHAVPAPGAAVLALYGFGLIGWTRRRLARNGR